ncbi:hypothetical protein Sjap_017429 [Stephania japonica]|uniref:High mobility group B protein 9 n=1 Tax=Stephania japonica TaxID=461633 RepID=A0AAP0I660_9MAGN
MEEEEVGKERMRGWEEESTEMPLVGVQGKRYPAPMATHEELLQSPSLFFNSLKTFHSSLGTRFMTPVIGGKELDLHVLYVEVTKRGGFQKVVEEKKWKDVGNAFNFSPTATSASYVLRKHYLNLLLHFEQVYFFKLQGPLLTPTVLLPLKTESATDSQQTLQKTTAVSPYSKTPSPMNCSVVGIIDGKFDYGYLVTVKVGSEVLHGVLYHPSAFNTTSPSSSFVLVREQENVDLSRSNTSKKRRRRRRHTDPLRPKPNRSGYNFFFAEKHSKLKSLYPNREKEFTKMIGESWGKLTPEERTVYQDIGVKDKERYKRELKEYKERKKKIAETDQWASGSTNAPVQTDQAKLKTEQQ